MERDFTSFVPIFSIWMWRRYDDDPNTVQPEDALQPLASVQPICIGFLLYPLPGDILRENSQNFPKTFPNPSQFIPIFSFIPPFLRLHARKIADYRFTYCLGKVRSFVSFVRRFRLFVRRFRVSVRSCNPFCNPLHLCSLFAQVRY